MSRFPSPRNIRSNWKSGELNLDQCAAEISSRVPLEEYGRPVESRCWVAARGWRKGMLKRVDVAYESGFASIRFSGQFYTLKMGERSVV